jgi:hypothetical protein
LRAGAHIVGPYRYRLWRTLSQGGARSRVLFVMLNPSTADAVTDDPTLRRCIGFATAWGFARLEVCNLFAYRSSDPRALRTARDPVGPRNDSVLRQAAQKAELTVVAWGTGGALRQRGAYVATTLLAGCALYCVGHTRAGHPRHPLYVPKNALVTRYGGPGYDGPNPFA